ncbi:MAG TPA: chemotaxis protein CheB [Steroidobacteraceae bacterium]|nr:chemotaxis protein CheB [Steroidobacteraceae bacterium]
MSTEATQTAEGEFFVVGIGASAGGVEALAQLFDAMPADIEAALVVVTHLGPHRETLLAEIISRTTKMPVANATHGARLQPGHVYVLPAEHVLTVKGAELQLLRLAPGHHERNPIDVFFTSVAKHWRENSVGIVLSGAGSDGTLGVKAIKEEGGLTIAQGQNGSGPAYDSMPLSAVASGLVDLVLPAEQIGAKLQQYVRSLRTLETIVGDDKDRERAQSQAGAVQDLYAVMRKRVGHDFHSYKERTFIRRVQRRMQVRQVGSMPEYVDLLRQDSDEPRLLFRDLLIGVTSFFRDGEAFAALEAQVIPQLFANAGAGDTIRVWVPGCATGEEAYSLALLLREHMLKVDGVAKVQVFATDIDEPALAVARSGRYPAPMLENVAPERLKRFFRQESQSYVLAKEVRDMCIFSAHSVIRDPPFSRMDLVSCRNLLIYFNTELQDSVLPVFHYALKPNGYLFLGPAETISRHTDLFAAVDKKQRIFQRRATLSAAGIRVPTWVPGMRAADVDLRAREGSQKEQRLRRHIEANVLEQFTPAHIVVEGDGSIIYYSARTGKYLEPQIGSPSRQIQAMARRGLRLELRTALREAVERRQTIVRERVEVDLDDRVQLIRLTVHPVIQGDQEPLYLIVFTDLGRPLTREEAAHQQTHADGDVAGLEHELRETRDRLQATVEEYETALEELKSGNEELVSVNEELQSTNEELETSKEELQSVNEELHTVNSELASKVDELHHSNADLRNLFESTQIATVFLDRHLIIRSYTPAVTGIFNLIPGDRGRPITDIAHQLEDVDVTRDIRRVLDEHTPLERPVRLRDGKVFHLMRILPYRTTDEQNDGVLITFVNITEVVAAEEQQRMLVSELNHRVRNMLQVVIGLANQTLHRSADMKQFENAFMGRVQSLARAYELVSRGGWHQVSIAELLDSQLAPFAPEGGRYRAAGAPVLLTANAALAFGLVLYELATNATKYGALSVPNGQVELAWGLEARDGGSSALVFSWRERGGPRVSEPTRRGFGSELLERQLRYELNGKATMEFLEDGLQVMVEIPASSAVVAQARPIAPRRP